SARRVCTRRDRRSSTPASTSATAGSSSPPTRASLWPSSPAGTSRGSPGDGGRCVRPGSSPKEQQLPPSSDAATPFGGFPPPARASTIFPVWRPSDFLPSLPNAPGDVPPRDSPRIPRHGGGGVRESRLAAPQSRRVSARPPRRGGFNGG